MDWFRGNLQETIVFSNHQIKYGFPAPFSLEPRLRTMQIQSCSHFFRQKKATSCYILLVYIYINALLSQKNASLNTSSLGSKPAPFVPAHLQLSFPVILFTAFLFQDLRLQFSPSAVVWELKSLMIPGIFEKTVIITLW